MNPRARRSPETPGPVSLQSSFSGLSEYFSPRVVGEVNDVYVKVTKTKGQDVPWHAHDGEDEMFLIFRGTLNMELRGQPGFELREGEFFIVPRGVEHRVWSEADCWIVLIESKTTEHTGKVRARITKSIKEQL